MQHLRVVFMGTPDFAVPTLQALIEGPHEVVGVFCQPDKAKGRGKKVQMPPVKEIALEANVPVFQPDTLKTEDIKECLHELRPDIVVVVAYGKILPPWLIHQPQWGCINVHASLLPAYRGAAPIHWAILNGDTTTGITIMQMDEGLDTGDILVQTEIEIEPEETTGELFDRLALLGGSMINEAIDGLVVGTVTATPQDNSCATHTRKVTKDMGYLQWQEDAVVLARKIRGLSPSPGCVTFLNGKRLKIWKAYALTEAGVAHEFPGAQVGAVGTVIGINDNGFAVQTGNGVLAITEVQPENKKRMKAGDFCRGHQLKAGMVFDEQYAQSM